MQPLKITIQGDFWDCQIYRGRLYLWSMNGCLAVYDWDKLVRGIFRKDDEQIASESAFIRGDFLYGRDFKILFGDSEIRRLLHTKFKKLSKKKNSFSQKDISKYEIGRQDNPFKELTIDTEISSNKLYALTEQGLLYGKAHSSNPKYPVSSRPEKIWDCPSFSLQASPHGRIALSSGNEGLYEYDTKEVDYYSLGNIQRIEENIFQISKKHSTFCNWSYSSIYSSSCFGQSFMSIFNWRKNDVNNLQLSFQRNVDQKKIFRVQEAEGMSWGGQDKIYKIGNKEIDVVRFIQGVFAENNYGKHFSERTTIPFEEINGKAIGGRVAFFGTIVEFENTLMVIQSDDQIFQIPGPITRWRVYPRSRRYENHLHVILDDKIEIYSFNQDYFVNQESKNFGMKYKAL